MQHRIMKNRCCDKRCGEYCGGKKKDYCDQGNGGKGGCCVGSLSKDWVCGVDGMKAPCVLPGNNLHSCDSFCVYEIEKY